jgi:uncharacterized phage-like protein YoqJ
VVSAENLDAIELARVVYPLGFRGPRYLAVMRGYCDESYDKDSRIYSLAGFIGRDKEWKEISRLWHNRCLKDKIECYHSADCDGAYGDFAGFSKQQIIDLNTDLVSILVKQGGIVGFGMSILLEDHKRFLESSEKALRVLGNKHPYFLGMEYLVSDFANEIRKAEKNYTIAFIFDQQEEFQGQAKQLYDNVRIQNPDLAKYMGTLTYADKNRFRPLQIADKLTYEVMKNMLNMKYHCCPN